MTARVADRPIPHGAGPGSIEAVDVAVVGAGVSGLYTAWSLRDRRAERGSLLTNDEVPSVALFERSERVGGRLHSVAPPGAPHLRAELGGMRYVETQALVAGLVDHLGLETRPFPSAGDDNLVYLRGSRHRLRELTSPELELPFELSQEERGLGPTMLLARAILAAVPDALELGRADWALAKRTREALGRPLYDVSFRELMAAVLSPDAVELAALGEGYETFLRDYNAADLLQVLCSLAGRDFLTPVEGYDVLPRALADGFVAAGGDLRMRHRLLNVERMENGILRCIFDVDGELAAFDARAVVLALPRSALELLDQQCFLFDDREARADLSSVAPVPASKLFLAYDEPWWEALGSEHGGVATDLPLRQAIYFGHEGAAAGADPGARAALLMASYNNSFSTWYWADAFDLGRGVFEGREGAPAGLEAPVDMVEGAQRELAEAHGVEIPDPYWAAYRDWSHEPFGGGWAQWRLGARSFEIGPRVRSPVPGAHLFIVGDTYSDLQGWVEGALSTAERVLQDNLRLPWPADRLPADYELGP